MEPRYPRGQAVLAWQHSGSMGPWAAQGLAGWHSLAS